MKIILAAACMGCILSCRQPSSPEGSFNLLPRPVDAEFKGNSALSVSSIKTCYSPDESQLPVRGRLLEDLQPAGSASGVQLVFKLDEELDVGPEGYTLEISRHRIRIAGKDQPGLLYGFVTLHQLMEDADEQGVPLPLCTIRDFPLLSYRAVHLDMKHHLEQRDYYYRLMDRLAAYKINGVIAEMEDKLAYERQPTVASTGALTIGEWKALSDYAMERNIEISPLIQGLGHASFILKHEEYRNLRDDPESDWAFNPLDPGTYKVQFDLYRDAMEATPYGRYLHVGGDEVHTTGRGSGKSPLELQLLWLDRVSAFAEENGRIPIFWDDMPLKHAGLYSSIYDPDLTRAEVDSIWESNEPALLEFLDRFPKNCIYMRWNYSVPEALGNLEAMSWFREHGFQVMGATAGQTRWILMPQEESNMEHIRSFALSSIQQGLEGLFLTLWEDDSPHFELYMRGITAFAEYTWAGERRSKQEIKAAYRQREFSFLAAPEEFAFIDRLEKPVAFWNNALLADRVDRRYVRSMKDPMHQAVIELPGSRHKGEWSVRYAERLEKAKKMLASCDSVATTIDSLKSLAPRNLYRLNVYSNVNRLARFAPEALLALEAYDTAQTTAGEKEALHRISQLQENFNRLRKEMEEVYSETRIIEKPADYILDQDHAHHLANQTITFDWQFTAELFFLEELRNTYSLNN